MNPLLRTALSSLLLLLALWRLFSVRNVSAHAMYQTAVLLDFDGNRVGAELQLPIDRLSISFRLPVDQQHFPSEKDQLRDYILQHVRPVELDGKPFRVDFLDQSLQTVENAPYLVVHLMLTPPPGEGVDHFMMNYDVIAHEIVTHVVLISIRSDKQHPIPPNDPVLLGMIRNTKLSQVVDRMKR